MIGLLTKRNRIIKEFAESDKWREVVNRKSEYRSII